MIQIRKADARGATRLDWLDSRHSFSFAGYYDPRFLGYRDLVAINDDRMIGGSGFPTHPHRDMEIISYVVAGGLKHRDSTGAEGVIGVGEVQRMRAGTGIRHSEYNAFDDRETRFLQIWIRPDRQGLTPGYEQIRPDDAARRDRLAVIASTDGRDGSLQLAQDAVVLASTLSPRGRVVHRPGAGRHHWVQVVDGAVAVNGTALGTGDGAALAGVDVLVLDSTTGAEVLVFDLA